MAGRAKLGAEPTVDWLTCCKVKRQVSLQLRNTSTSDPWISSVCKAKANSFSFVVIPTMKPKALPVHGYSHEGEDRSRDGHSLDQATHDTDNLVERPACHIGDTHNKSTSCDC